MILPQAPNPNTGPTIGPTTHPGPGINPSDPVALLSALIQCPSVTPADHGALAVLEGALTDLGFRCERVTFSDEGSADIDNLFATLPANQGPHLAFNGHTDVVPPGAVTDWQHDPFSGKLYDGAVFGRGAVDMKGGIAAYVAAIARLIKSRRDQNLALPGSFSLLITGDEEGIAVNGSVKLAKWVHDQGHRFDACIVGEPTSVAHLGDTIKVGRRGSLNGQLTITGTQGHVAYPQRADNPITRAIDIAAALRAPLDEGTDFFQPSHLEITSIDTGNCADNIIPAAVALKFNIRFNVLWTSDQLKMELEKRLLKVDPQGRYRLTYRLSGEAFHTVDPHLVTAVSDGIEAALGVRPAATTGGGTSDARFMKDYCPVVEFGLVGTTMHQVNERVPVAELEALTGAYGAIFERFFDS